FHISASTLCGVVNRNVVQYLVHTTTCCELRTVQVQCVIKSDIDDQCVMLIGQFKNIVVVQGDILDLGACRKINALDSRNLVCRVKYAEIQCSCTLQLQRVPVAADNAVSIQAIHCSEYLACREVASAAVDQCLWRCGCQFGVNVGTVGVVE